MARLTPAQITEKHNRRLKAAVEDMRTGVENVSVAPTEQAAKKIAKMRAGIMAAIDSGKVERGLRRVSVDDWKKSMINVGIPRVAAGIDNASGKVEKFYGELMPYIDTVNAKVQKMPDVTLEDGINRMTTFVREMSKFKRQQ